MSGKEEVDCEIEILKSILEYNLSGLDRELEEWKKLQSKTSVLLKRVGELKEKSRKGMEEKMDNEEHKTAWWNATDEKKVIEAYFRALGWVWTDVDAGPLKGVMVYVDPDGICYGELPNICQDYPSFKKFVLERMEEEGYRLSFEPNAVWWWTDADKKYLDIVEPTKDNEILRAAVQAATLYFQSKEKE